MTFAPNEALVPRVEGVDGQRRHHHRLAARQHRHDLGFDRRCAATSASRSQHTDQSSSLLLGLPSARPAAPRAVRERQDLHRLAAEPEPRVLASRTTRRCASPRPASSHAPRLDQLRASFEFGVEHLDTSEPGASGGNPLLDPWKANAFDISYEKYFEGTKGYVSAAFFYKDLRSYIFTAGAHVRLLAVHRRRTCRPQPDHDHRPVHRAVQRPGRHGCRAWN